MRVAVIGAGIVGSSVSWHLVRRGAQVVIIDADGPGAGVTNWSVAWVNASNKTETREYFELNVAGMVAYRELAAEIGSAGWWNPTGHLRWADEPNATRDFALVVELLRSWDYHVESWTPEAVRGNLEPEVRFLSDDTEVFFYPDEGWIGAKRLSERLVDHATRQGAKTYFGATLTDVVLEADSVVGVVLSDGHCLNVDAMVNAAGPSGAQVASLVGRGLPMRHEPGFLARVSCATVPIGRVMHAPHVELRPDGPRSVVLHSREIDALIELAADTHELFERLKRLAIDAVPALAASELAEARIARRPIPGDGFPAVGAIRQVSGYYEAITHSGVTLGVIVGRLLAEEIIDGTVDGLIAPYRPDRFTVGEELTSW
jgi:glycine/D-amino acid oxidase-like deaminating enzyme